MQLLRLTEEGFRTLWAQAETNLPHYAARDAAWFQGLIEKNGWLAPTGIEVPDDLAERFSLATDADTPEARKEKLQPAGPTAATRAAADRHNAPVIYEALKNLPRYLAIDRRLWTTLLHTLLFDYVCDRQGEGFAADRKEAGKNFFAKAPKKAKKGESDADAGGQGQKRYIFVNCASRLWWACAYLYDEKAKDPYHFLDVVEKLRFAGTTNLLSSANIFENKNVVQGAYRVFEKRIKEGKRMDRTKDMVEAYRYLNLYAGATVIDMLTTKEVEELVEKFFEYHDAQPSNKGFQMSD